MARSDLEREIGRLETRLDPASGARAIDELATIRRGLADGCPRKPAIELPNLRLGFACKQRWEDMVGDDRVRACGGCDRPVFNLSAMTRDEAERVLATRGLTPCVRFYRRPDGTVMTADCPSGARPERRKLAVMAGSLAAGTALAAPSARAEPAPAEQAVAPPDATADADPDATDGVPAEAPTPPTLTISETFTMGIPLPTREFEMGMVVIHDKRDRPTVEWSLWGRLGVGVGAQHPTVLARRLTPPEGESAPIWEAAVAAELTVGIARDGALRLGAWGELRTSSGPVAGGELVLEGLPPHPWDSPIRGEGSVVLRAGGNGHVVTGAVGVGYIGSRPRSDPWIAWAGHAVGARVVASMNHSLDDPRDWSATIGVELEPIGALHAVLDLATGH
jgi:hypothetical protein